MGKVKMIYIDPPYNTGNDFVYHDDFAQSADEYDEHNLDDEGNRYCKNTDSNDRFNSDWYSKINMRLMVARSLLTEEGVVHCSFLPLFWNLAITTYGVIHIDGITIHIVKFIEVGLAIVFEVVFFKSYIITKIIYGIYQ